MVDHWVGQQETHSCGCFPLKTKAVSKDLGFLSALSSYSHLLRTMWSPARAGILQHCGTRGLSLMERYRSQLSVGKACGLKENKWPFKKLGQFGCHWYPKPRHEWSQTWMVSTLLGASFETLPLYWIPITAPRGNAQLCCNYSQAILLRKTEAISLPAALSLSASELCWGTDGATCLGIQLAKLSSSSSFPTICLEGCSAIGSPQLRQT